MDDEINTEQESLDATLLDQSINLISSGQLQQAHALLTEVVSHSPDTHIYQWEKDRIRYMKFWNEEEFLHFTLNVYQTGDNFNIDKIKPACNVYPRAFYHLGFVNRKLGELDEALLKLDKGISLEPDNPCFYLEKANVFAAAHHPKKAVSMYDYVLNMGAHIVSNYRARALRGKAVQLIELGDIDFAESLLLESLVVDPDSPTAIYELKYISHLRSGGTSASLTFTPSPEQNIRNCTLCGTQLSKGITSTIDGRIIVLCDSCAEKRTQQ